MEIPATFAATREIPNLSSGGDYGVMNVIARLRMKKNIHLKKRRSNQNTRTRMLPHFVLAARSIEWEVGLEESKKNGDEWKSQDLIYN